MQAPAVGPLATMPNMQGVNVPSSCSGQSWEVPSYVPDGKVPDAMFHDLMPHQQPQFGGC